MLVEQESVLLDFRDTASFDASGTILLYAELDRVISLAAMYKPVTIRQPLRRKPREVLKQIGIFHLTEDRCDVIPEKADVVYWKATKGATQSGGESGPLVEAVADKVNRDHVQQIEKDSLWRSVSEVVSNSVEHAYKKPRRDGFCGLPDSRW